jgi:hypothetical protein
MYMTSALPFHNSLWHAVASGIHHPLALRRTRHERTITTRAVDILAVDRA